VGGKLVIFFEWVWEKGLEVDWEKLVGVVWRYGRVGMWLVGKGEGGERGERIKELWEILKRTKN
jgi:hypothetical protein